MINKNGRPEPDEELRLYRNACPPKRIDLCPLPTSRWFGDKLTVVGEKEGLKGTGALLGNNAKKLSDTDFFPIAMGIVLGMLFGKLNISFPAVCRSHRD